MFPVQDKYVSGTKYAGRSRAVVIDNEDPQKRGRIRVNHPLTGETDWIPYLQIPGLFSFPEIDDIVYVEADCGWESHLVAWGNFVKGAEGDPSLPEEFQRLIPTNRGIYTPGGHLVEFDDGDGITTLGAGIRITASNGAKIHIDCDSDKIEASSNFGDTLSISKDEGIQASTPTGTSLSMKNGEVIVEGQGTTVTLNSTSCLVEDAVGNTIETGSSGIKLTDSVGGELNISSGKVALGSNAVELLDLLEQAFQALSTQTAPGFGSPTSTVATFSQLAVKIALIKGSL